MVDMMDSIDVGSFLEVQDMHGMSAEAYGTLEMMEMHKSLKEGFSFEHSPILKDLSSLKEIPENKLGITGWIQGTGYTGESGYEIFVPNSDSPALWGSLLNAGATPVGLGARDTLRLEKGFLLSGVDFCWPELPGADEFLARDSWESNVPFGWGFDHQYIGKERVESHSQTDARLLGIKYTGKGPLPRPGKIVTDLDGNKIGMLTSGAPSPSLGNVGIGMGYISGVDEGDKVLIVASERRSVEAIIVTPPFI